MIHRAKRTNLVKIAGTRNKIGVKQGNGISTSAFQRDQMQMSQNGVSQAIQL